MIFVALGTQKFQFNRLLQMIDQLLDEGKIKETVFAQIGNSDYRPKNYKYASFLDKNEFEDRIRNSNLLITHSGVATIITGIKNNKKVIVVPRLAKYGEHVDDHQLQLIKQFDDLNLICTCENTTELAKALDIVRQKKYAQYKSNTSNIIENIEQYIKESC